MAKEVEKKSPKENKEKKEKLENSGIEILSEKMIEDNIIINKV